MAKPKSEFDLIISDKAGKWHFHAAHLFWPIIIVAFLVASAETVIYIAHGFGIRLLVQNCDFLSDQAAHLGKYFSQNAGGLIMSVIGSALGQCLTIFITWTVIFPLDFLGLGTLIKKLVASLGKPSVSRVMPDGSQAIGTLSAAEAVQYKYDFKSYLKPLLKAMTGKPAPADAITRANEITQARRSLISVVDPNLYEAQYGNPFRQIEFFASKVADARKSGNSNKDELAQYEKALLEHIGILDTNKDAIYNNLVSILTEFDASLRQKLMQIAREDETKKVKAPVWLATTLILGVLAMACYWAWIVFSTTR